MNKQGERRIIIKKYYAEKQITGLLGLKKKEKKKVDNGCIPNVMLDQCIVSLYLVSFLISMNKILKRYRIQIQIQNLRTNYI